MPARSIRGMVASPKPDLALFGQDLLKCGVVWGISMLMPNSNILPHLFVIQEAKWKLSSVFANRTPLRVRGIGHPKLPATT